MDLREFKPLYTDTAGPRLSAALDVTRDNEAGAEEVALRWRALRDQLGDVPADLLDAAEQQLLRETEEGGPCERDVVVDAHGVQLERLFPGRRHTFAHCGPLPRLTHVVTAEDARVPYVLVEIDRTGADITVSAREGESELTVNGSHDELTKVNAGGWSEMRWQHRVEDSWERNAAEVAAFLDRVVDGTGVEIVAVAGDVRAAALLRDAVADTTRERLHILDGGGRGENRPAGRLPDELTALLEGHAAARARAVAERFAEANGHGLAVRGLPAVVDALRRAQVDTLLLPPDWEDETRMWFGPDPLQLGMTEEELEVLGVQEPSRTAACDVVLRAAAGSDAAAVVIPREVLDLRGTPAALLRFTDASTG
jgi:hypothetical protein